MSVWLDAARVAAAVNLLLLAGLASVWARNYLALRSMHAAGLLVFALLLFAENAVALYVYQADPRLSAWFTTAVPVVAWRAMLALHVLELVALVALARVTFD
ncbi:hypothetical protein [Salinigranum marinum]|uniref:hypothetical protein n=1 Tax=Salinigranum marinum TaxID=1515595 RepID=UPI002989E4DA|nr:hypothetical protein [Salinigranum marinum]